MCVKLSNKFPGFSPVPWRTTPTFLGVGKLGPSRSGPRRGNSVFPSSAYLPGRQYWPATVESHLLIIFGRDSIDLTTVFSGSGAVLGGLLISSGSYCCPSRAASTLSVSCRDMTERVRIEGQQEIIHRSRSEDSDGPEIASTQSGQKILMSGTETQVLDVVKLCTWAASITSSRRALELETT